MLIAYARVSTHEQNLDLQLDAFKAAGVQPENIFTDKKTGKNIDRDGLRDALSHLRPGDTLVVWRLDRLGRTLKELIDLVNDLNERGIGFKSLQENMDSTTSGGELIFHIFGALAQFERKIIVERTRAGLDAARARGRLGGRPKKLDDKKRSLLYSLYDSKEHSIGDICEALHVSRATVYKYLKERDTK
jgi:DNA invertase Pin-like site-specific DNA recombinase